MRTSSRCAGTSSCASSHPCHRSPLLRLLLLELHEHDSKVVHGEHPCLCRDEDCAPREFSPEFCDRGRLPTAKPLLGSDEFLLTSSLFWPSDIAPAEAAHEQHLQSRCPHAGAARRGRRGLGGPPRARLRHAARRGGECIAMISSTTGPTRSTPSDTTPRQPAERTPRTRGASMRGCCATPWA